MLIGLSVAGVAGSLSAPSQASTFAVVDAAASAELSYTGHSWDAEVVDFDRDGWQDLLVSGHDDGAWLFLNDGDGSFTRSSHTFPLVDRHDCAAGHANADRRPDFYCTVGAARGWGVGYNELWIHRRDGTLVNRAEAYGVADEYGRGRRTTFVDANQDAYRDLFVGNYAPRHDTIPSPNRLFVNDGGRAFRDAPEYGLDEEAGAGCAQAVRFNRDELQDLLVCTSSGLRLYRNDSGGTFIDVASRLGLADLPVARGAMIANLDRRRRPDLVMVSSARVRILLRTDGRFVKVFTAPIAYGRAVAVGDVDGDGWNDVYAVAGGPREDEIPTGPDEPDVLLVNGGTGRSFSQVTVPQPEAGLGQWVTALDHDRNGKDEFVVLNGLDRAEGPLQLIAADD